PPWVRRVDETARGALMFTVVKRSSLPVCLLVIFLGAAISGAGQSSAPAPGVVAPPVLTFVLDSSGGLRPLIGIPGSASVGSAVHINVTISQAAVPPSHDYVLANTSSGLALFK